MLLLPSFAFNTLEDLAPQLNEEAYVTRLEQQLEAKLTEIQEWRKHVPVAGTKQPAPEVQELHQDVEEDTAAAGGAGDLEGQHPANPDTGEELIIEEELEDSPEAEYEDIERSSIQEGSADAGEDAVFEGTEREGAEFEEGEDTTPSPTTPAY